MLNDNCAVEVFVYRELHKLRKAERWLCAAFEKLPAERAPTNSIVRFLYHLADADERMDRLDLLLDTMEDSPLETGTVAA